MKAQISQLAAQMLMVQWYQSTGIDTPHLSALDSMNEMKNPEMYDNSFFLDHIDMDIKFNHREQKFYIENA